MAPRLHSTAGLVDTLVARGNAMTLDINLVVAALPSYEVGAELGRGGWGVVLAGRHRQLGRDVAIKQLPRAFGADPAVRARFVTEARLLAALDHPHIVPIYDYVEQDGLCLLVMEKLTGGTVWSRFTETGFTTQAACALTMATCAALHCAHGQHVLHRDIKPENVMFATSGVAKVTDFGIAKVVGGGKTMATHAGEVLGTPAYMAPEQAQAKELTPSTDVYATGVMLYELLSGRLPFLEDENPLSLLYRHVHDPPTPLRDLAPAVPAPIANVVMRALAKDPAERFPSAESFGVALAEAATVSWGVGWLGGGGTPVLAAGPMVAATERPSGPVATSAGGPAAPAATAATTAAEPAGSGGVTPSPASGSAGGPVRPSIAAHAAPRLPADSAGYELVPLQEVFRASPPTRRILTAVALLLVVIALALVGVGSPSDEEVAPGVLSVGGVDPATVSSVELDLAEPVVLTGRAPDAGALRRVRLSYSVLGVQISSAEADAAVAPDGTFSAAVDSGNARYLVAGTVRGEVEFLGEGGAVLTTGGHHVFPVRSAQAVYLTAPGVAGIALVLFVLAYAESLIRSLRRGKKRYSATAGMVVIGGLAGVTVVAAVWLLGVREPTKPTVAVCAAAGAVTGWAAGSAARAVRAWRRGRRTDGRVPARRGPVSNL